MGSIKVLKNAELERAEARDDPPEVRESMLCLDVLERVVGDVSSTLLMFCDGDQVSCPGEAGRDGASERDASFDPCVGVVLETCPSQGGEKGIVHVSVRDPADHFE